MWEVRANAVKNDKKENSTSTPTTVQLPWEKEPVSASSINKAIQKSKQEINRIRGKLPLAASDERTLLTVLKELGESGIVAFVQDVSAIKSARLVVVMKLEPVPTANPSEQASAGYAMSLFRRKGWQGSMKGEYVAPTYIPFLLGLPSPSKKFENIFGLRRVKYTYAATPFLLGAYEKRIFGGALRRGSLDVKGGMDAPKSIEQFLIEKSEPKIKQAIDSPDLNEVTAYLTEGLEQLFAVNSEIGSAVAGLGGIGDTGGEVADFLQEREKAIKEFATALAKDIKRRKFTVKKAIKRAHIVGAQTLGSNGRYIQGLKNGFGTALEDTLKQFEDNMKYAIKSFENSLEDGGYTNPKNTRKRGRRKRKKAWNKALRKHVPAITEMAANATIKEQQEILEKLDRFGKAASQLGRWVMVIEVGKALTQERWEDKLIAILTIIIEEAASIILSVVGRYVGATFGSALGLILGGGVGVIIGLSVGYFAGAFLGAYYGNVLGGKIAASLAPKLIEELSGALDLIESEIEAMAEQLELDTSFIVERKLRLNDQGKPKGDSFLTEFERMLLLGSGASPSDKR